MLHKFVSETGRDWDQWLPYILCVYREVLQASMCFSPFELLYGREKYAVSNMPWEIWPWVIWPWEICLKKYGREARKERNLLILFLMYYKWENGWRRWQPWPKHIWRKPRSIKKPGMTSRPGKEVLTLAKRYWWCYKPKKVSFWPSGRVLLKSINCWAPPHMKLLCQGKISLVEYCM